MAAPLWNVPAGLHSSGLPPQRPLGLQESTAVAHPHIISLHLPSGANAECHRPRQGVRSRVSPRLQACASAAAATAPASVPPDPWGHLREAAEAAMEEADRLRKHVSGRIQDAVEESVENVSTFYHESLDAFKEANLQKRAHEVREAVSFKVEELAFEASREASRIEAIHNVSERFSDIRSHLWLALVSVDCQYQIRQRLRQLQWELVYHSLVAFRSYQQFQRTPAFPFFAAAAMFWMIRIGLLQQLFCWLLWTIPLLPIAARALTRAALIEGNCPSCGHHFIGPKKLKLSCRQCNEVVWQPRGKDATTQTASKSRRSPVIVVDLEPDATFS